MAVTQLAYLVIEARNLAGWRSLGDLIGFEVSETPDTLRFRLDADREWRIAVEAGEQDRLTVAGWEVGDAAGFDDICGRLQSAGVAVHHDKALAKARGVMDLCTFVDPEGMTGELFWGPRTFMRNQFRSPHQVRFLTGSLGMGHITMAVRDFRAMHDFYTGLLGMTLTETAEVGPLTVGFFRANGRHHSLAITETPDGRSGVAHIMVEVSMLDELGSIRDRVLAAGHEIVRDLGRHPTDGVVSMYLQTDAPFDLEVGWGSFMIDGATWPAVRHQREGWGWGHRVPGGPQSGAGLGEMEV